MGSSQSHLDKTLKSSCTGDNLSEEHDDVIREGQVFLVKRKLGQIEAKKEGILNHWALTVKFNDSWVTLQANNHYGRLLPEYSRECTPPPGSLLTFYEAKFPSDELEGLVFPIWLVSLSRCALLPSDLTTATLSPKQLRNIAAKNWLNGREYSIGSNDCQAWVVVTANHLKNTTKNNS